MGGLANQGCAGGLPPTAQVLLDVAGASSWTSGRAGPRGLLGELCTCCRYSSQEELARLTAPG